MTTSEPWRRHRALIILRALSLAEPDCDAAPDWSAAPGAWWPVVELARFENRTVLVVSQCRPDPYRTKHHHGWRKSWKRHRKVQAKGRLPVRQGWPSVPCWKVGLIFPKMTNVEWNSLGERLLTKNDFKYRCYHQNIYRIDNRYRYL